ncbi:flagellar basal body P-ring formation protein FlgA [Bowmanella sp. Y26]|uniref:flagellar basal body P-ring formation chaperone FlgA n=1 Tax=Bowmanella yangjiangensis TaxID=2811230 RepID=UPI001BDC5F43|nr:flagellar basal body P-ring formation chaperone FlgA [Bowmanella yangjiangensis]MBT1062849.1 flagellar basal body P-ring formation protein FlgA [Bowmanella yangjiangensis]
MRILIFLLLTIKSVGVLAEVPAIASPHQQVSDTARQYVLERLTQLSPDTSQLDVEAATVDERLQIPQCAEPFIAQASENSLSQSNVTVRVSCVSSNWFLYVMVKVRQTQAVVVTKVPVSPGTLLDESQLEVIQMELGQLHSSTFANISDLAGARSKRRLRAGQPLEPSQLCYVCKGDSIVIRANAAGLQIKTSGIALQDGNVGDTILIKNRASEKQINARVLSAGEVAVGI